MSNLFSLVDRLIVLSLDANLIEETDIQYVRNRILSEFGELSYEETEEATGSLYDTLDALSDLAMQKELIGDTLAEKDIFTSRLMNLFLDKPSVVNAKLQQKNFLQAVVTQLACFVLRMKASKVHLSNLIVLTIV